MEREYEQGDGEQEPRALDGTDLSDGYSRVLYVNSADHKPCLVYCAVWWLYCANHVMQTSKWERAGVKELDEHIGNRTENVCNESDKT